MSMLARNLHRDLGYFYVGLIISFALSGIFLNHRQLWHPARYSVETKEITATLPADKNAINEDFAKSLSKTFNIEDNFRRFRVEKGQLRVSFEKHDIEIELATGKGKIERYIRTPILGHMTKLHQDTSQWWIYYSDVFGISMLTIAITGLMLIPSASKQSFKSRGWKLALAGIIFPLIFLFVIS